VAAFSGNSYHNANRPCFTKVLTMSGHGDEDPARY
jgi:hypothetical protein